ncbi:MAG: HAMP domain-containing protein [candidate division NC10 bacterium]|nr:HAMP domain-containing protein [candidate division NC10 bacterium]
MKSRLLWKLLGINVLVLGVVILIVWLAIDYLASNYFMVLMKRYHISPTAVHRMFLDATHRSLIWASLATLALAVILSFLLTRKVLTPLSQMTGITRKIASGDYTARVRISSNDEVGQLATAFNQMADSLQRIEQLRKTMVIDVAHELRTPLTNMRGYLEALSDGVMAPSKEIFESLHEETLRLAKLVEDLLQLARADAARGTLRRKRIDLQVLALEVLDLFRPKFATKGIVVETELSAAEGETRADPEKLAQVFRNLLQNAWQYTPHGGHVRISAERVPGRITLIFANTGEGIAEEDLPFIFERFYRGEKSRSREHGGAGIGLAIVKELIEAHRGEVGAESTPTETRVWFTLPA